MTTDLIRETLRNLANPNIAGHSQRFFKTGPGEYGEGDRFLGIRVPVLRKQVGEFQQTTLQEIQEILSSPFHEERLFALLLLVHKFSKGKDDERSRIYQMYLDNTDYINNWDLVDCSAHKIVGAYLGDKDKRRLYHLARSDSLWERRIAIMASFDFIRNHEFDDALKLSMLLLGDREDLIHKAVGWMLREIGKRDIIIEKAFLESNYKNMPRTMLRYAIEKFPEPERLDYLQGRV